MEVHALSNRFYGFGEFLFSCGIIFANCNSLCSQLRLLALEFSETEFKFFCFFCFFSDGNKSTLEETEANFIAPSENLKLGASASSIKPSQPPHTNVSRQRSGSAGKEGIAPIIRCDSFGEGDDKYRLDADYIKRYLGELSLLEESQLIQLRTCLAHLQKGNV